MRIIIATPIDGTADTAPVACGYARRLAHVMTSLKERYHILPEHLTFSTDIVRARNRAAWYVIRKYQSSADFVLWWDADVVPIGDLDTLVTNMIETGAHVIGAPYLRKGDPPRWAHMAERPPNPDETAQEVLGIGLGFTLTSLHALALMADYSEKYTDFLSDGTEIDDTPDVFDLQYGTHPITGKRMKLSEDFSFCQRWREIHGFVRLYWGHGNALAHIGEHAYKPGLI